MPFQNFIDHDPAFAEPDAAFAPAGFPSPAADYAQKRIDLNRHLVLHPEATFFVRMTGDAMQPAGIFDGDTLIVDRALTPAHRQIVVAVVDGEFLVRRLYRRSSVVRLLAENPAFAPMAFDNEAGLAIWGVVRWNLRRLATG